MMDDSVASITVSDDIKPYKIHVSSKYLELTKKKLELTRLPHEILLPKSKAWNQGTPKSEIEPLIDFWLERYSWRTQESEFNKSLPQFRTAITIPSFSVPFRIHFTHIKSPHAHALPLLLLPAFPLTNLSLEPLIRPLTHPDNVEEEQPFNVVVPSIPGLGFSDAFNAITSPESSVVEDTAHIFNALMLKLGYEYYVASSTGSGINSPADIDYQLPRLLASKHRNNCLGIHVIDPPVQPPVLSSSPLNWTKFAIAKFFHAPIFGYTATDWAALKQNQPSSATRTRHGRRAIQDIEANPTITSSTPLLSRPSPSSLGINGSSFSTSRLYGLREPNTLAYALCDSPVGLLSLVLNGLQRISPGHSFSSTDIINITQLAWLPGPEGALRFWSSAAVEANRKTSWSATPTAVTVFLGDKVVAHENDSNDDSYTLGISPYICPAWAGTRHNVIWAKRQEGRAGLIAWERKEAIIEGIRGLTGQVLQMDPRLAGKVLLDEIEEVEEEVVAAAVAITAAAVVAAEEAEEEELEGVVGVKGVNGVDGNGDSRGNGGNNGAKTGGNGGNSKNGGNGKNVSGSNLVAGETVQVTQVGGTEVGPSGVEEEVVVELEVESPDTVIQHS